MSARILASAAALLLSGCVTYVLRVAPAPATAVPESLHGVKCGPAVERELTRAAWAFAEVMGDEQVYVLASPAPGVHEAQLGFEPAGEGRGQIKFVRLHYRHGRLSTYQALLRKLVETHGPPQASEEVKRYPYFVASADGERLRPMRYVVHEWRGPNSTLVLVGGLEARENLETAMEYHLLLLPADAISVAATTQTPVPAIPAVDAPTEQR